MNETRTPTTMVAVFPKQASAIAFAARLAEGRDDASDIVRKGRTVTFTVALRPTDEWGVTHESMLRDLVGYYGTLVPGHLCPKSKAAFLNGIQCVGEY